MSLWWTQKEQLDEDQLEIIEDLPLRGKYLVLGPPGSGKTNILVRRAQFVRTQEMPNVLVLAFTRSLVEFMKTGCFDAQGREIFPPSCMTTIESWIRGLYRQHNTDLPEDNGGGLEQWKRTLATGAMGLKAENRLPEYDALFIDEAQDLLSEEIELIKQWSPVLFFVGDSRQKIFDQSEGLEAVRQITPLQEHTLSFHYRLAPEICRVADRILNSQGANSLQETQHYVGPEPGTVNVHDPLPREAQIEQAMQKLKDQVRVYAGLIAEGDKLAIVVARRNDREEVFYHLENDPDLKGKSQVIRAREDSGDDHDPAFDPETPICILTVKGCKGLEFRSVHWLFCEDLKWSHTNEVYYTVVTRAKTSLDLYYTNQGKLPEVLARACPQPVDELW